MLKPEGALRAAADGVGLGDGVGTGVGLVPGSGEGEGVGVARAPGVGFVVGCRAGTVDVPPFTKHPPKFTHAPG